VCVLYLLLPYVCFITLFVVDVIEKYILLTVFVVSVTAKFCIITCVFCSCYYTSAFLSPGFIVAVTASMFDISPVFL
jgi:hypothetical protein